MVDPIVEETRSVEPVVELMAGKCDMNFIHKESQKKKIRYETTRIFVAKKKEINHASDCRGLFTQNALNEALILPRKKLLVLYHIFTLQNCPF